MLGGGRPPALTPPSSGRQIRARLRPGARAPVLRRLLPCASRRAPSGARPAAMPAAYSEDLAWRVVMRLHFFRQDVATVCDKELGLGVSRHYVSDVMRRFEESGSVATHQGAGADTTDRIRFSREEDNLIVRQVVGSPRTQLRDHHASFKLENGVVVSYSAFCGAVRRHGFSRKRIRKIAFRCE